MVWSPPDPPTRADVAASVSGQNADRPGSAGRWVRLVAVAVGALMAVGVVGEAPVAGAEAPASAPLVDPRGGINNPMTGIRLRSVTIPSVCGMRRARLVNGVHPDSAVYPEDGPAAGIWGLGIDTGRVATYVGDVTGDGVKDGMIIVGCQFSAASSYITSRAFVYRSDGKYLGVLPVGRNIPPSWAPYEFDRSATTIIGGTIKVRVWSFRPSDPHCCASILTVLRFRRIDGVFRRVN